MFLVALYFISATVLGLAFETGEISRKGIATYTPDPSDQVSGRLVTRGGQPFGSLVGRHGKLVARFDEYRETELAGFVRSQPVFGSPADRPSSYAIKIEGEPTTRPLEVSRKVKILETAVVAPEKFKTLDKHTIYMRLQRPLKPGQTIHVELGRGRKTISATFEPARVVSDAIHVPHVGFEPDDARKFGYFSAWLGKPGLKLGREKPEGSFTPEESLAFAVIDDVTGNPVVSGPLTLVQPGLTTDLDKTSVYKADFSALRQEGTYRMSVSGVGLSRRFSIRAGVRRDLFRLAMRGYYHQRSGIPLEKPYTDWVRPRSLHPEDGFLPVQSRATLMDTDYGANLRNISSFKALSDQRTEERVPEAWGGWHDAGDWDRRIQHLKAVRSLLLLSSLHPAFVESVNLNIPPGETGSPDVLTEALWGLDVFRRLQLPDGGVRGGIEGGAYPAHGEASWTDPQQLFVYAPDPWSSYLYAATAVKAAGVLKRYSEQTAQHYTESAVRAFDWAEANAPSRDEDVSAIADARNLAAAELFRETTQDRYAEIFRATTKFVKGQPAVGRSQHEAGLSFLRAAELPGDRSLRQSIRDSIIWFAKLYMTEGAGTYDQILDPWRPYGWGAVSNIPEAAAEVLIPAHVLTGDRKFLDAVLSSTFFGLGANPDNMVYTTGLGESSPREVLHIDRLALGNVPPPPGITIFGTRDIRASDGAWWHRLVNRHLAPFELTDLPVHETYQGFLLAPELTEYTIENGLREPAFVWGYLAAVKQNGQ